MVHWQGPGGASLTELMLGSLTVGGNGTSGGIVDGGAGRDGEIRITTVKSDSTSGDIDIQPGGFIGGRKTSGVQMGRGVKLTGGGDVTVGGTVQGDGDDAEVTSSGGSTTISDGGTVVANPLRNSSGTRVRSWKPRVFVAAEESTTIESGATVSGAGSVFIASGSGHTTRICGSVTSTTNVVYINYVQPPQDPRKKTPPPPKPVPNPGDVRIDGTITAPVICINADSLIFEATAVICARKIKKKVKAAVRVKGSKIKGFDRADREINKVVEGESADDRDGALEPGATNGTHKLIGEAGSVMSFQNAPNAIDASESILIATGPGGTIDMRNNLPGNHVLVSPGPITLMADNVLLDPGVQATDLAGPGPVSVLPSGDARAVGLAATDVSAYPGLDHDVYFLIANLGNVDDSYSIVAADSLGWGLSVSETNVMLNHIGAGSDTSITVHFPLVPTTVSPGDSNKVTFTVTSDTDPSVTDTFEHYVMIGDIATLYDVNVNWAWWDADLQGAPGDTLRMQYWVHNLGFFDDVYATSPDAGMGWSVSPPPDSLELVAGADSFRTVLLAIPPEATPGTENFVVVNLQSGGQPGLSLSDTLDVSVDNTVPTLLRDHQVTVIDDAIHIEWWMSELDQGVAFEVYRVKDAGSFELLAPQGLAQDDLHVTFNDTNIEAGSSYTYRIFVRLDQTTWILFETSRVTVPAHRFWLGPNHPNPFNPSTTLSYSIPTASHVNLRIFDMSGRLIDVLADEEQKAGSHNVIWRGRDRKGRSVAAGIYFVRLHVDDRTMSRKIVLLK